MYFMIKSTFGSQIVCNPKVVAQKYALLKEVKEIFEAVSNKKIWFSISKNPDKNDKNGWEDVKLNEIA